MSTEMDSAMAAFRDGRAAEVDRLSHQALRRAVADGDPALKVEALCMLARLALRTGDVAMAASLVCRASRHDHDHLEPGARRTLFHLAANVARLRGDFEGAAPLLVRSVAFSKSVGDARGAAEETLNLAHVQLRLGYRDAARAATRSYVEFVLSSDEVLDLAVAAIACADIALGDSDVGEAARLVGAVRSVVGYEVLALDPDDELELNRLEFALRDHPRWSDAHHAPGGSSFLRSLLRDWSPAS